MFYFHLETPSWPGGTLITTDLTCEDSLYVSFLSGPITAAFFSFDPFFWPLEVYIALIWSQLCRAAATWL